MCLTVKNEVKNVVKTFKGDWFIGWKIMEKHSDYHIKSIYQPHIYLDCKTEPYGTIGQREFKDGEPIGLGALHIYLDKHHPVNQLYIMKLQYTTFSYHTKDEQYMMARLNNMMVVPFYCNMKDVIAFGLNHDMTPGAAMRKLYLKPSDKRAALNLTLA
jgi:hypothetical protein